LCGYFREHEDDEVLSIPHFINAIHFARDLIKDFGYEKRWIHISSGAWWNKGSHTGSVGDKKYYGNYRDWEDWEHPYDKSKTFKEWEKEQKDYKTYDDWNDKYLDEVPFTPGRVGKEYYHHAEHFSFSVDDEDYIKDCIEVGQCPMCNSNHIEILKNTAVVCESCESAFYIPIGKTYIECLEEMDEIIANS